MNFTATIRDTPFPSSPPKPQLFSLYEEEPGGTRPDRILTLSGPQVEQLLEIMHFFGALAPDPKQVIEVPKIFPDDVPMRTAVRDMRLAEQLVEVPTIVYVSSLRALVEQNENIPVPRGRGGLVGRRGLQGFSLNRIQQRLLEQITLTFQFRVVDVFKVLVMDRVQQLHPLTQAFAGWGFSHFSPKRKKVRTLLRPRRQLSWPRRFFRRASGRTKLVACGCGCPLAGGTFCAVSQKCGVTWNLAASSGTSRRAWCWQVRGLPSYSEAHEAAACGD